MLQENECILNLKQITTEPVESVAAALYELTLKANNGYTTWKPQSFIFELKEPYTFYFGLYVENELAGYICGSVILDEASINNFAVHPSHQKRGFGRELLTTIITYLKKSKIKKLFLEVRVSNERAYRLYSKSGFLRIDQRKNYYQNPIEDAYILELALNGQEESWADKK